MFKGWVPILMIAAALAQSQRNAESPRPVSGVSIPAELSNTVRAERVHRGDPVQFRTVEAVLIKPGVVIPANAKLLGRVVGAAPRQGDKPSWLVLLVERAEWKNQSVPLHAYISAQIRISRANNQGGQTENGMATTTSPRRLARESARVAALNGVDISSSTKLPQDASSSSPPLATETVPLKDLRIVRDKEGITYLFSMESNVNLPTGTLFALQNQSPAGTDSAAPSVSQTAAPASPK
jgi:hypothetical protein